MVYYIGTTSTIHFDIRLSPICYKIWSGDSKMSALSPYLPILMYVIPHTFMHKCMHVYPQFHELLFDNFLVGILNRIVQGFLFPSVVLNWTLIGLYKDSWLAREFSVILGSLLGSLKDTRSHNSEKEMRGMIVKRMREIEWSGNIGLGGPIPNSCERSWRRRT